MKPRREPPRTLTRIRADASPEDRNGEALKAKPVPFTRPANSKYVTIRQKVPQTLEELRVECEPYGDAAVSDTCWSAVSSWLMSGANGGAVQNALMSASSAVCLCSQADSAGIYPDLMGKATPPELPNLSPDDQFKVRAIAAQAVSDWREAGCPMGRSIESTYQYIAAYKREFPIIKPEAVTH